MVGWGIILAKWDSEGIKEKTETPEIPEEIHSDSLIPNSNSGGLSSVPSKRAISVSSAQLTPGTPKTIFERVDSSPRVGSIGKFKRLE